METPSANPRISHSFDLSTLLVGWDFIVLDWIAQNLLLSHGIDQTANDSKRSENRIVFSLGFAHQHGSKSIAVWCVSNSE
jgi:hypothetical protein